jgi:hypothetical protein
MRQKLNSRKFWLSVAAFLGSIAASIAGIVTEEKWITITGMCCGILSAGIYAACEAYVDGAHKTIDINEDINTDADK